jgi:hypothetical protein
MNNQQQQTIMCLALGALLGAIVLLIASRMTVREKYEEVGPTSQIEEVEEVEEVEVTSESMMTKYLEHVHPHSHDAVDSPGTSGEAVGSRVTSTRMSGIKTTSYDALGDVGVESSTGGIDEAEDDNVGAEAERRANESALRENVAQKAIDADEKAEFARKAVEDARLAKTIAKEAAADAIRMISTGTVV